MNIDRRKLLGTTAAVLATASLQRTALAQDEPVLTLIDPSLTQHDARVAHASRNPGSKTIQPDLVRQWRNGLGKEIAAGGSAVAYVRWDKALLLSDLARESGMMNRQRRLDRAVFEVRIDVQQPARARL